MANHLDIAVLPWMSMKLSDQNGRKLSRDDFFDFCQLNRDMRIERNSNGEIEMMPPTGGETGRKNFRLSVLFGTWDVANEELGKCFDSSTGYNLPNGAIRTPDVSWVSMAQLEKLTSEQKKKFLPLCPDFALELTSPSDSLAKAKEKMEEYRENGTRLGWLIHPKARTAFIYRPDQEVEQVEGDATLEGEDALPGFTLALEKIWNATI